MINDKRAVNTSVCCSFEDEDFTELLNWRCQECRGEMIDGISISKTGVDVYIDC